MTGVLERRPCDRGATGVPSKSATTGKLEGIKIFIENFLSGFAVWSEPQRSGALLWISEGSVRGKNSYEGEGGIEALRRSSKKLLVELSPVDDALPLRILGAIVVCFVLHFGAQFLKAVDAVGLGPATRSSRPLAIKAAVHGTGGEAEAGDAVGDGR